MYLTWFGFAMFARVLDGAFFINDFRMDNFPGIVISLLETFGNFSFSAGEKAGMREGKTTSHFGKPRKIYEKNAFLSTLNQELGKSSPHNPGQR
jgi:hypothetical protein